MEKHDHRLEHKRLQEQSAKVRADALRSQIMAVDSFCSVAEVELRWYSIDKARTTAAKIHHAMSNIEIHLREPGHIFGAAAVELWDRYTKLQVKVKQMDRSIAVRN